MSRRRSLCIQSETETLEDTEITRSTSYTPEAARNFRSQPEGVRILQGHPLKVDEPSPRRITKFRFPGARILRAGFGGFHRNKKPELLKSPCVWVDPPKLGAAGEDSARNFCIKGKNSSPEKALTDCECSNEALDLFPGAGVLSLPLADPLHKTVFTLSRLTEAKCTADSLVGTPLTNTSRTDTTRHQTYTRSSASSFNHATPRTDYTSSRFESSNSLDASATATQSSISWNPFSHVFTAEQTEEDLEKRREKEAALDSDMILRIGRRSFTSMDYTQCSNGLPHTPSAENEATPILSRPKTRFDSRVHDMHHHKPYEGLMSSTARSGRSLSSKISENLVVNDAKSFRSDTALFDRTSRRCSKLDMGLPRLRSSQSERNLCIGRRPRTKASTASLVKPNERAQRMKFGESLVEPTSLSCTVAESRPLQNGVEDFDGLHTYDSHRAEEPSSPREKSHLDHNGNEDVLDESKSLAMWFDWLEERSDLTRKEILYRLKCQKAFIEENNETLAKQDLIPEDLQEVICPRLKDQLRQIRHSFVSSSSNNNIELAMDDDDIIDINLSEIHDENDFGSTMHCLQLNI